MKKFIAALTATSALVAMAPAANAAPIIAGAPPVSAGDPFVGPVGTLLASTSVNVMAITFSGTLRSAVYQNASGTLDFWYQVVQTGAGTNGENHAIQSLTSANFVGYLVDGFSTAADLDGAGIFTAANNPGAFASTYSRNASGITLTTEFGSNPLSTGEISRTYIFSTNAVNYSQGTFGLINGSSIGGFAFQPAAPVPEPGTWALMILGFGAVGYAMRRRPTTRFAQAV